MMAEVAIGKGAHSLWQANELLDYTIEVDNEQFKVHRFVMACVSDYFRAMLTGGMLESRQDRVKLEGLSADAVSDIINFIYTGQLGGRATAKEVLLCAVYLQIPTVIDKCTEGDSIDEHNCLNMLTLFKKLSLEAGIKRSRDYIKSNIDAVLVGFNPARCTHDEVLNLIDCWECGECDLFNLVKRWISADYENRKGHVNDVMSLIRFCLISSTDVAAVKDTAMFTDCEGPWCDLVEKALTYHDLPTHKKVLDDCEQATVRNNQTPCLMADQSKQLEALRHDGSWQQRLAENGIESHWLHQETAIVVNNFVIVFIGLEKPIFVFDPRTLVWSTIASFEKERFHFSLVHHDQHLFAFGGRNHPDCHLVGTFSTDTIERYSFETDRWKTIDSKMPLPLRGHLTFSVSGAIYVTGGFSSAGSLYCFHPLTETWETKAAMLDAWSTCMYKRTLVLDVFGEQVITIINTHFTFQYYSPSTDQWSMWRNVGTGLSNLTFEQWLPNSLIAVGNTLYLVKYPYMYTPVAPEKWRFGEKGLEEVTSIKYCSIKPDRSLPLAIARECKNGN